MSVDGLDWSLRVLHQTWISDASAVEIPCYDVVGRLAISLVDGRCESGVECALWMGLDYADLWE